MEIRVLVYPHACPEGIREEIIETTNVLKALQTLVGGPIEVIWTKESLCPSPDDTAAWKACGVPDGQLEMVQSVVQVVWDRFDEWQAKGKMVLVNENGKLIRLPNNPYIPMIAGTFLVVDKEILGCDEDDEGEQ